MKRAGTAVSGVSYRNAAMRTGSTAVQREKVNTAVWQRCSSIYVTAKSILIDGKQHRRFTKISIRLISK